MYHHPNFSQGNPLYLRQLLYSLEDQGLIHVDLRCPCWAFDLDKIAGLRISDTVVSLLRSEMKKLGRDLQLGLAIASCLGSVKISTLDILSNDLRVDLQSFLHAIANKGFMDISGGEFRFAHDKIEEGKLLAEYYHLSSLIPHSVLKHDLQTSSRI